MKALQIRQAILSDDGDLPYISSAWLKNFKDFSRYFAKRIDDRTYYENHHRVVIGSLSRKDSRALVAIHEDSPEIILGFLVWEDSPEKQVIHYCYVNKDFQRMGIARELLKAANIDLSNCFFTHWTITADGLIYRLMNELPGFKYNPYLM